MKNWIKRLFRLEKDHYEIYDTYKWKFKKVRKSIFHKWKTKVISNE